MFKNPILCVFTEKLKKVHSSYDFHLFRLKIN